MSSIKTFFIIILAVTSLSFSQPNSFVVKGSLVGSDGKPMVVADVHLLSNAPRMPRFLIQSTRVSPGGKFELTFGSPGLYRIQFTGVDHYALEIPFYVQDPDPVILSVQLKAYELPDSFSNVRIIGDFNNFSFYKDAQPMTKREDGSYVARVQVKADTLTYQLIGVENTERAINGTQSDFFVYDSGGDYRSVIQTKGGSTTIVFDPSKFRRSSSDPIVRFQNEASLAARFYQFHLNLEKRRARRDEALRAHLATGKPSSEFSFDWSNDLAEVQKFRESESDTTIKNAWLIAAIEFGVLRKDSTIATLALSSISPTSLLWSYSVQSFSRCIRRTSDDDKRIPYLKRAVNEHSDREIKPFLIGELLDLAAASGDNSLVAKYFQMLVTEFDNSPWTQMAKTRFAPNRAIQVGNPVPDFSVTSLEDSSIIFTSKRLLGRIYLIDFWAVWCAPCVAEMKHLHEAYDQFKSQGLTILSASCDFKPEDVAKFRKEKWPMPWLHTFVKNSSESEFAKAFEVLAIPKPVLVGRDGKILAAGDDLRGEKLIATLSKIFSQ